MDDISPISTEKLGESPDFEVTGKIMVVAIIILFMVVVFCLFLHLYAKFCLCIGEETTASGSQHRRRRRRFVFAPGREPPSHGALRRGLDPLVLRSLPILVFQSEEFKDGLECAVCLSDVVEGEKYRLLPKCNHGFHVDCIDMWFQSHSTCPLCRNPVGSESCSSSDGQNASENSESSEAENSVTLPTNMFIWGNQTQITSIGALLEESSNSSFSTTTTAASTATAATTYPSTSCNSSNSSTSCNSSSSSSNRHHGMLVMDIPSESTSSSISPSASRFAEDDLKSPMSARLRSLKRLLSRDRRLNPCSPSSIDAEQGGGAQS